MYKYLRKFLFFIKLQAFLVKVKYNLMRYSMTAILILKKIR